MKSIKHLYQNNNMNEISNEEIYPFYKLNDIREHNLENKFSLLDYIYHYEYDIENFFNTLIDQMLDRVRRGLGSNEVAKEILFKSSQVSDKYERENLLLIAYSYAANKEYQEVSDQELIIISSLVYYYYYQKECTKQSLIEALSVASLFANISKHEDENKDISILFGSIFIAYLNEATVSLLEYTKEIAIKVNDESKDLVSLKLIKTFDVERLSRVTFN